jgi:hypothetical protein
MRSICQKKVVVSPWHETIFLNLNEPKQEGPAPPSDVWMFYRRDQRNVLCPWGCSYVPPTSAAEHTIDLAMAWGSIWHLSLEAPIWEIEFRPKVQKFIYRGCHRYGCNKPYPVNDRDDKLYCSKGCEAVGAALVPRSLAAGGLPTP